MTDYIDIPGYSETDNQSLTYSVWFRSSGFTPAGFQFLVGGSNVQAFPNSSGCSIRRNSDGYLYGFCSNSSGGYDILSHDIGLDTTEWHFAAITYDYPSSNFSLYYNGEVVDSDVVIGYNAQTNPGDIEIGRQFYDLYYFNGSIDEVAIFNRSLSADEIKALYNSTSNRLFANFTGLSNDTYNYSVYAMDANGNLNVTSSRLVTVGLNGPPTVYGVELSSTSSANVTTDNLTVSYWSADPENDTVTNITDWRLNGTSVAVLNMPLDTDISAVNSAAILASAKDTITTATTAKAMPTPENSPRPILDPPLFARLDPRVRRSPARHHRAGGRQGGEGLFFL